jgi:hypothetical protein
LHRKKTNIALTAAAAEHSDADIFAVRNLAARRRRANVSAPKECAGKATYPTREFLDAADKASAVQTRKAH